MLASYRFLIAKLRESQLRSSVKLSDKKSNIKVSLKSENDRKRVTFMCSTLVLSFTFCWIIYHATHLAKIFGMKTPKGYVSNINFRCFIHLITSINIYKKQENKSFEQYIKRKLSFKLFRAQLYLLSYKFV